MPETIARMSKPERIIVVGPSWVGDMVMAQSLFKTLKQQHADNIIDVIAPAWSLPVLARMPEVRSGIALQATHKQLALSARYRLGRQLRHAYDRAIILPRSLKSALVTFFARVPLRTGFLGEYRYGLLTDPRKLDKQQLDQTVKRFVALAYSADTPVAAMPILQPHLQVDNDKQQALLQKLSLSVQQPIVALMPGAEYGPAKQWPLQSYAALAVQLQRKGVQCWILGSAKDRIAGDKITELSKQSAINLCGQTTLADVIDLIAATNVVVSNDSGLMHIAAAVNKPVIAIYGSSSPTYTPPLTADKSIHYSGLSCSPCFARTCRYQHYDCLNNISVDRVFADVCRYIDTQPIKA